MDRPDNELRVIDLAGAGAGAMIDFVGGGPRAEDNVNDDDDDEEELSDDDGSSSGSDSSSDTTLMMDRLQNNDPELTTLHMSSIAAALDDNTNTTNWKRVGAEIGKNTHLELISFHHVHTMTETNYEALFHGMVQNRSIIDIDILNSSTLGGRIFLSMVPMMERIVQLTIEDCSLGIEGSILLSRALQGCSQSSMEEINFDKIGRALGMVHIIKALTVHDKLEKISLRGNNIETCGCVELLSLLSNRGNKSRLITLDLGESYIGGAGASLLASGMNCESCTITHLNLDSTQIDTTGFEAFANLLRNPSSRLKSLSLNDTVLNDDDATILANSLVNNSMLSDLYLGKTGITFRGLQALSTVLRSSQSRLKHLSLRNNRIKDKGAILLANSLANNHTLSQLNLKNDVSVTSKGWKAFSKLLCRRGSSIMDTYRSNHTLQKLLDDEWTLSGDLMLLLLMNREGNKRHVARQKIIKYHLNGKFEMQTFVDMDLGTLPHIVSWMGHGEISLLYQFIRNMQSFFNFSDGVKAADGPMPKRQKVYSQPMVQGPTAYVGDWWHEKPQCD